MNKSLIALLPLLSGAVMASPLPKEAQVRAANTLIAEYVNTVHFPCTKHKNLGKCPEDCTNATDAVVLRVTKNEAYVKNGLYGDKKIEEGDTVVIDIKKPVVGQNDADIFTRAPKLRTGDTVRVKITHYFMDIRGLQSHARPVTLLQLLSRTNKFGETVAPGTEDDQPGITAKPGAASAAADDESEEPEETTEPAASDDAPAADDVADTSSSDDAADSTDDDADTSSDDADTTSADDADDSSSDDSADTTPAGSDDADDSGSDDDAGGIDIDI